MGSGEELLLNGWSSGGCLGQIRDGLGYRLVLKDATYSNGVHPGSTVSLSFNVFNRGFGGAVQPAPRLCRAQLGRVHRQSLGARRGGRPELRGGCHHPGEDGLSAPRFAPAQELYALQSNPAYDIELANSGVWDGAHGLNVLTSGIVVGP